VLRATTLTVMLMLLLGACGASPRNGAVGGGQGICPDHPDQCGGKCCGATCQDVSRDPRNCGDCDVACPAGTICLGGNCGCPPNAGKCSLGQSCCGALGCVSLESDIRNCGGCGTRCPDGATCQAGHCRCAGQPCEPTMNPTASGGPPPGFCSCADACAGDPTHDCVGMDCCYGDYVAGRCTPATSCGAWIYK
jgi:hypothetical protein